MRITVYTAIIDGYDKLEAPEIVCPECDYIVISDTPILRPPWKNIVIPRVYSPRVESRYHKVLCRQPGDMSVWADGHAGLWGDTAKWVKESLDGYDIALRKHPVRDCVYDEADHCIEHRCDYEDIITLQMEKYRADGYPEHRGLSWAGMVMRRHNCKVGRFNAMWWNELRDYSLRDQLSFDYCAWKMRVRVKHLAVDDPHVKEVGHVKHTRRVV